MSGPNLRPAAIAVSRQYLRYFPLPYGKGQLWSRVVEPRWAWSDHRYVGRTRFGARMQGNTCELLQQYVYYFGVWEPQLTAWLTHRLRPGDVFVDVGASVGYFTLLAARLVGPTGTVLAFEPSPRAHDLLTQNVRANRVSNVRVEQVAVGDRDGQVTVFAGDDTHWGLASVVPAAAVGARPEAVVTMRPLTALVPPQLLARSGVVKIDAEGAEAAIVHGLLQALPDCHPELEFVIEVGPARLAAQGHSAQELFASFTAAGYAGYLMPNAYDVREHLRPPARSRLERLHAAPSYEADLVFSRRAAP